MIGDTAVCPRCKAEFEIAPAVPAGSPREREPAESGDAPSTVPQPPPVDQAEPLGFAAARPALRAPGWPRELTSVFTVAIGLWAAGLVPQVFLYRGVMLDGPGPVVTFMKWYFGCFVAWLAVWFTLISLRGRHGNLAWIGLSILTFPLGILLQTTECREYFLQQQSRGRH
jgi:hypothetical protein